MKNIGTEKTDFPIVAGQKGEKGWGTSAVV
jgi:hypothetical protein